MAPKVYLEYCLSSHMITDLMTKALPHVTHEKHTMAMGMVNGMKKLYRTLGEGVC